MGTLLNIGIWEVLWIAVVLIQVILITYLHHPEWKAFVWTLPLPFTFATLAFGYEVDITNLTGPVLVLIYANVIRILYYNLKLPIIWSISVSALTYCCLGSALVFVLPGTSIAFWVASAAILAFGFTLYLSMRYQADPGHRSSLPIWIKIPVIVLIILFLVAVKANLRGFATTFPIVGILGAYEARHSLWTMSRQVPVKILTLVPLIIVCRIAQPVLGLGMALALGWVVFLVMLTALTYSRTLMDKKAACNL